MTAFVASNRLGTYCVPAASCYRPAARAIVERQVYEADTLAYCRNLGGGDVIHAGAYFGDFLPGLAARCDRLWAFEPNPENYACARATMALNGLSNVTLINAALGATWSRAHLVTAMDGVPLGGASYIDTARETGATLVVPLDDVIDGARAVSLLHLDVEGYEQQALQGSLRTIRRDRPVLILEIALRDVTKTRWFEAQIQKLGYRMTDRVNGNAVWRVR